MLRVGRVESGVIHDGVHVDAGEVARQGVADPLLDVAPTCRAHGLVVVNAFVGDYALRGQLVRKPRRLGIADTRQPAAQQVGEATVPRRAVQRVGLGECLQHFAREVFLLTRFLLSPPPT
jgi:hypothetical protein